jgi:hypothetical protein
VLSRYLKFEACSRDEGLNFRNGIDVSSRGEVPYKYFSPFTNVGAIPHPCQKDLMCKSVEDIWQGSKIIELSKGIKPDYFIFFGKKNFMKVKGKKVEGFWLGEKEFTTDIGVARRKIYVPAYVWMLNNKCKLSIRALIEFAETHKGTIYLFDFDTNGDMDNPAPLSHSVILAKYMNKVWGEYVESKNN